MEFHCNLCSVRLNTFEDPPLPDSAKGFFADCKKHIFCESCKEKIKPQCLICKEPAEFMEIRKNMRTEYRFYFKSLVNIGQLLNSVENFQEVQENVPFKKLQSIQDKVMQETDEIAEKQKELDRERGKNLRKQHYLKGMQERLSEYR